LAGYLGRVNVDVGGPGAVASTTHTRTSGGPGEAPNHALNLSSALVGNVVEAIAARPSTVTYSDQKEMTSASAAKRIRPSALAPPPPQLVHSTGCGACARTLARRTSRPGVQRSRRGSSPPSVEPGVEAADPPITQAHERS